jgi:hypothetical protein
MFRLPRQNARRYRARSINIYLVYSFGTERPDRCRTDTVRVRASVHHRLLLERNLYIAKRWNDAYVQLGRFRRKLKPWSPLT